MKLTVASLALCHPLRTDSIAVLEQIHFPGSCDLLPCYSVETFRLSTMSTQRSGLAKGTPKARSHENPPFLLRLCPAPSRHVNQIFCATEPTPPHIFGNPNSCARAEFFSSILLKRFVGNRKRSPWAQNDLFHASIILHSSELDRELLGQSAILHWIGPHLPTRNGPPS